MSLPYKTPASDLLILQGMGTLQLKVSPVISIQRVDSPAIWPAVDGLLREYLPWVVQQMGSAYGIRFEESEKETERHHAAFAEEAVAMMRGEGVLLLGRLDGLPAAVVALKRIDATTAEVKRLYVRPDSRGLGLGRALMDRLMADANDAGFRTLRLETMSFMKAATAMYEALGFRRVDAFDGSQAAMSGVAHIVHFMQLDSLSGYLDLRVLEM